MRMHKTALSLLVSGIVASAAFAADVTCWVPPYAIGACKTMLQKDFGGVGMKDGITILPLQFWQPGGASVVKAYGNTPSDADIEWFRDWGHANNIKVLLCLFNAMNGGWDWNAALSSFRDNKDSFVNSLVAEVNRLELDGVDIDLEGNGDFNGDKAAYVAFAKALADKLHPLGKIVTCATFADQYNAPNWDWWPELLPILDGLATMGYDYSGSQNTNSSWYTGQVSHATMQENFMIGMPGWVSSWQGDDVVTQIDWVLNQGTVGIGIWDAQLEASGWQTAAVWNKLAGLVQSGQGPYTLTATGTHGSVSLDPEAESYDKGTVVTARALADEGWCFAGWSTGATAEETAVTVNGNTTITALFAPMGEQIVNGDYASGTESWNFSTANGGVGAGSVANGAYTVQVTTGQVQSWSCQLRQGDLALVQDSVYTLQFTAWADADRNIEFKVGQSVNPWGRHNGDDSTVSLTVEKKIFTYTFTMDNVTDMSARIEFNGGFAGADWHVDDVSFMMGAPDITVLRAGLKNSSAGIGSIGLDKGNLRFSLPVAAEIGIEICDLRGRSVYRIDGVSLSAGMHELPVAMKNNAAGLYVVKLVNGKTVLKQDRCRYIP